MVRHLDEYYLHQYHMLFMETDRCIFENKYFLDNQNIFTQNSKFQIVAQESV